ncbi:undecaprenyl-diphosphate phosphatase [Candidatus Pacearchaeota archaeon]|nr:undecaprenyl-diphosphate phosphatase [Candidatus Pacearchaeota archaeon]
MLQEIIYAIIQSATEFLPVSSSGHLALISNLIGEPDLSFFVMLHLASLITVIVFTRKELYNLASFNPKYKKLWLFLITATIPAGIVGLLLRKTIEASFSSLLFLSFAFIFTGIILFLTQYTKATSNFSIKNSLLIGIFQAISIFPGISRSGMTISSALFSGIEKEKAARFSFLLFIPVTLGAFVLELNQLKINSSAIVAFFICLILSIFFLNLLVLIIKKEKFWMFSFYCWLLGIISLILYLR